MRPTNDLHEIIAAVARDSRVTRSETIARLSRASIGVPGTATLQCDRRTGIDTISLGRALRNEDVRALDDDA